MRHLSRDGLLAEVVRLRTRSGSKELRDLREQLERTQAKLEAAMAELADVRAAAQASGLEGDEVGGHPALASYMRTWWRWRRMIWNLPGERKAGGFAQVQLIAAATLLPGLQLFELTSPRSESEAKARNWVRRCFTVPSRLDLMSRYSITLPVAPGAGDPRNVAARTEVLIEADPGTKRFQATFFAAAALHFLRPSIWYLITRTAEDRDRWKGKRSR